MVVFPFSSIVFEGVGRDFHRFVLSVLGLHRRPRYCLAASCPQDSDWRASRRSNVLGHVEDSHAPSCDWRSLTNKKTKTNGIQNVKYSSSSSSSSSSCCCCCSSSCSCSCSCSCCCCCCWWWCCCSCCCGRQKKRSHKLSQLCPGIIFANREHDHHHAVDANCHAFM